MYGKNSIFTIRKSKRLRPDTAEPLFLFGHVIPTDPVHVRHFRRLLAEMQWRREPAKASMPERVCFFQHSIA